MLTKQYVGMSVVLAGLMAPGVASAASVESVSIGANTATLGTTQNSVVTTFGSTGSQCLPLKFGFPGPTRIHCSTPSLDADFINDSAIILRTVESGAVVGGVRIGISERALKSKVSGLKCKASKQPLLLAPKAKGHPINKTCTVGPTEKNRPGGYPPHAGQVNNSFALRATKAHPKQFKVSGFQLVKRSW